MSTIVERIEREIGIPGLAAALAERVGPTDLQSLLLDVYRRRAGERTPAAVLADYDANRFVRPCDLPVARLAEWDRVMSTALPTSFEQVELSPVTPLGAASVVAHVSQHWAVPTARNTEVVSDSTNVLALEAATRRRAALRADPKSPTAVHLATSHRHLRPQQFTDPAFRAHFRVFALVSAGRDSGAHRFELSALATHIATYLRALHTFLGDPMEVRVVMSPFVTLGTPHDEAVFARLAREFPTVQLATDADRQRGRDYYRGVCFSLDLADGRGGWINLADGGAVAWAERLLSNGKERLVVSGIGSEMVCRRATRARQWPTRTDDDPHLGR